MVALTFVSGIPVDYSCISLTECHIVSIRTMAHISICSIFSLRCRSGNFLNGENRNDIVNALDGAGAKGTFFFSKPSYYCLCPALFTDLTSDGNNCTCESSPDPCTI